MSNTFDPWRVVIALGWTLAVIGVCGMSGWIVARTLLEYVYSRGGA